MLNIYAGCPGLSLVISAISAQFTLNAA